jgi:hypothetical protein
MLKHTIILKNKIQPKASNKKNNKTQPPPTKNNTHVKQIIHIYPVNVVHVITGKYESHQSHITETMLSWQGNIVHRTFIK